MASFSKVPHQLLLPPAADAQGLEALELGPFLWFVGDSVGLKEVNGTYQVQLDVFGNSADTGDRLASNANQGDPFHAVISGLDADGGQAGDSYMHSKECTSGDQKPRHPRFSAGKALSALGPCGVMLPFAL